MIHDVPFSEWFAGSKIVDNHGRPWVMYHGTGSKTRITEFHDFRPVFFTPEKKYAAVYKTKGGGKGRVYACYLNIRHPFDESVKAHVQVQHEMADWFNETYPNIIKSRGGPIPHMRLGEPVSFTYADQLWTYLRKKARNGESTIDGLLVAEGSTAEIYDGPADTARVAFVPLTSAQIWIKS